MQVYHQLYQITPRSAGKEKPEKHRTTPAVWEAKTELFRRGFSAYPIRGTGPVVLDLIAWDERTVYGIAVRRTRGPGTLHPVTTAFAPLIRDLQALRTPGPVEIQLWITSGGRFHVYRVLPGGIMARSMP